MLIQLCNCDLLACLKRQLYTMLLTMDSGCDCCCNMMWRRLIAKRSHTVHSSSGYKNRRRTSLQHARTPLPPPPPVSHALPLRPTFPKFASNFLLHALKRQHIEICPLRCLMTFPVGLRFFMSVAIEQRKYVNFGFTKFRLKPLSDLRKTEDY